MRLQPLPQFGTSLWDSPRKKIVANPTDSNAIMHGTKNFERVPSTFILCEGRSSKGHIYHSVDFPAQFWEQVKTLVKNTEGAKLYEKFFSESPLKL